MGRIWLLWGCLLGFLSVALGAFGAHALQALLDSQQMDTLAIANQYMSFHALALLALGLWSHWEKWSSSLWAGMCFVLGTVLFSGSLYVLVLLNLRAAAFVTPVGGSLFLLGWILFAFSVVKTKSQII
ncbi:MAG: DUF423 domain-containing protein [Bdellovibrionales bacterium]|nr:DUF423 domain-containing protein [Bdellovibrionales bacterium]NQZ19558.1 DUF423 domain-containing protein [Bdellovibrionales bacterium]